MCVQFSGTTIRILCVAIITAICTIFHFPKLKLYQFKHNLPFPFCFQALATTILISVSMNFTTLRFSCNGTYATFDNSSCLVNFGVLEDFLLKFDISHNTAYTQNYKVYE